MEPFVAQLAALCAVHRTHAKWVFVPTRAIGRTLGDRLVLEGTDWVNLRFVTPLDVAVRMGAPFLVERGIDPSGEGLGPALIMRLLLDLPEEPAYFRPLATQPSMAQALWMTVRELRMAGVHSDDLQPAAFASSSKHSEFRALFAAYEAFLVASARGDLATVYEEAIRHPNWCPIQPQDCWTELPDVDWAPLQRSLIDAMPGERIKARVTGPPGASVPRRFGADIQRVPPDPTSSLAYLLSPTNVASERKIQLFHAGGCEAEIEEVFRRIIASRRSLDEVEIASASEAYTALIWEKACRYDWPVTLASGLSVGLTRPGRALTGFASWIESGFAAGVLRRLLQSGDVTFGSLAEVSPARAAKLLLKSEAAWGRLTYSTSLVRLAAKYRSRAREENLSDEQRTFEVDKANQAEQLLAWVTSMLVSVPENGAGGLIELQQLVDCALNFVGSFIAISSALDGAAAAALQDSIIELRELGSFRCSAVDGLRFVTERFGELHVGADRPRPGHLHVSRLFSAAFANRRSLFVVGLEEGRVFPSVVEDAVLLDAEREKISPLLRRSSDRTEEAVYTVLSRLAAASASPSMEICLSYSCRDLREYRYTFPSWLILQAHRVVTGDPRKSYEDLQEALGDPKSSVPNSPAAALGEAGWWLSALRRAGEKGRNAVLREYPALAEGLRAEKERDSPRFTEYDGFVPAAGKVLDPCTRDEAVSPTQLEDAAECPFRYFLKRGLRVDAVDGKERENDAWLDPLTRGSAMHDLYALLLRKCRDEGRRPQLASDREWFVAQGREKLKELRQEMPPPSDEVFDRESRAFLTDLELFVNAECDGKGTRTAIGLEVSFGRSGDGEREPLDCPDPIVVELGRGLRFRLAGRIDRIDQITPASFEIVDYKTGNYFEADWTGVFAGGRRLQHALYGLAAVELLRRHYPRPTIVGGVYYFPSAKGRQERVAIGRPSASAVTTVLTDLREVVASGLFQHATNESACRWCDFGAACGANPFERATAKLEDRKLGPYRRLVAHE